MKKKKQAVRKVMIIDDDTVSLSIAKAMLESEYEVITAKSGLQALGYLQENNRVDIILLDVLMPGTSGQDVLKALKKSPELRDIPVIFMTGLEEVSVEVEGISSGLADLIQKPIHAGLLKLKIERQLDISNIRKENQLLREKLKTIQEQMNQLFDEALKL